MAGQGFLPYGTPQISKKQRKPTLTSFPWGTQYTIPGSGYITCSHIPVTCKVSLESWQTVAYSGPCSPQHHPWHSLFLCSFHLECGNGCIVDTNCNYKWLNLKLCPVYGSESYKTDSWARTWVTLEQQRQRFCCYNLQKNKNVVFNVIQQHSRKNV